MYQVQLKWSDERHWKAVRDFKTEKEAQDWVKAHSPVTKPRPDVSGELRISKIAS